MIRNDCNELFLHARWLVTERKKEKEQETNRTNKRRKKHMRRNDCNELFLQAHCLVTCYLRTNGENKQHKRGGQTSGGNTNETQ